MGLERDDYDTAAPRFAINMVLRSPFAESLEHVLSGRALFVTDSKELGKFIEPGETVLDVGIGTGHITRLVQKDTGNRVIGLDLANLRTPSTSSGEFVQGDGRYLPIRDSAVNVVMLMDVLHLSKDPEALLREAFRVLQPGGRVIILEDTISEHAHGTTGFAVKLMNAILNTQRVWSRTESYNSVKKWEEIFTKIGFDPEVQTQTWHWNFRDLTPLGKIWPFGPFESTRFVATKR